VLIEFKEVFKFVEASQGRLFSVELVSQIIAQVVNRWIPTAEGRVRDRAACGICGGQSGIGAGFLRVLLFPLPIIIPPISPSS
jgi:hypothetical protein